MCQHCQLVLSPNKQVSQYLHHLITLHNEPGGAAATQLTDHPASLLDRCCLQTHKCFCFNCVTILKGYTTHHNTVRAEGCSVDIWYLLSVISCGCGWTTEREASQHLFREKLELHLHQLEFQCNSSLISLKAERGSDTSASVSPSKEAWIHIHRTGRRASNRVRAQTFSTPWVFAERLINSRFICSIRHDGKKQMQR